MSTPQVGDVLFSRESDDPNDLWDDTALIKAYDEAVSAFKLKLNSDQVRKTQKSKNTEIVSKWNVNDFCQTVWSEDGYLYDAQIVEIFGKKARIKYCYYGNEEVHKLSDLIKKSRLSVEENKVEEEQMDGGNTVDSDDVSQSSSSVSPDSEDNQRHPRATLPAGWPGVVLNHSNDAGTSTATGAHTPLLMAAPGAFPSPQLNTNSAMPTKPSSSSGPTLMPPPPMFTDAPQGESNTALYSMLMSWYMSGYHTGYYQALQDSKSKKKRKKKQC